MTALVQLMNLHYCRPGAAQPVLCGAELCIASGDRIGLTGLNGSGKTTLLHIMVGLLRPSAGRIIAFGRERHREADFADLRQRLGLVFQNADDQLFCPTVLEDVAFGPLNQGKHRADAIAISHAVLAQVGLANFANRITYELSGGEKRLVALAAVMAMHPDVLLLDEPISGLDPDARRRVTTVLNQLPQAMVVVSHDHHFLHEVATRAVRLEQGQITSLPEVPHCCH